MLRVFVCLGGTQSPVEIRVRPGGQNLMVAPNGQGKAHFWWSLADLEGDPGQAAALLRQLVPGVDRVWVGRDPVGDQLGGQLQQAFDGGVVECGYDQQVVSLTAVEPPRAPQPPAPPSGGVREPLHPSPVAPAGGMPEPEVAVEGNRLANLYVAGRGVQQAAAGQV